ncbi:MAG: T9SS type A sorting domain-containing protein [Bacteroidetes bacterium]|nr:T9SS type A sorting domain-containing protein [Bacteroidota bacterium]
MKKGGILFLIILIACVSFSQERLHYRWIGGASGGGHDAFSWNAADNWEIWIPESDSDIDPETDNGIWEATLTFPGEQDHCIIPAGRIHYPKYPSYPDFENTAHCFSLKIKPGGAIHWESPEDELQIVLEVYGNFEVQSESGEAGILSMAQYATVEVGGENPGTGNLYLDGQISLNHTRSILLVNNDLNITSTEGLSTIGKVTVNGQTNILSEQGLIIKANETGVGSFINNGELNFTSYAGAKVETYLSSTVGSYFMHFLGPTLLDSTSSYRSGTISGVRLQQFTMDDLTTNHYEWNALTDTTNHQLYPWIHVQPLDYNVPSGNGIAVANWVAGSSIMDMVGTLISEEVSYNVRPHPNNNLELVSNPFSAAISFDDLYNYGNNSEVIKGHYWIYDASTGNYYGGAQGASNGMIQVGQGFFVEVHDSGGNLIFSPSIRSHSNEAFRDAQFNILKMNVNGGSGGYSDELTIRFNEDATDVYDENLEVKKWNSFGMDATMIRSIADDGSELSVNALPTARLNDAMTSIPIHFECGYDAEYTFDFSGMETFEYATSIWIEDLQTGIWNSVSETNPTVTFNGSPEDDKERFLLHFVGPTSIFEADAIQQEKPFHIYTSNEVIYIKNNTDEVLQEVAIYNTLGQEIYRNNAHRSNLNEIRLKERTGFYIVQVRTDQSWVSEKVFINKE